MLKISKNQIVPSDFAIGTKHNKTWEQENDKSSKPTTDNQPENIPESNAQTTAPADVKTEIN